MESFGSDHLPKLDFFSDFRALWSGKCQKMPFLRLSKQAYMLCDEMSKAKCLF